MTSSSNRCRMPTLHPASPVFEGGGISKVQTSDRRRARTEGWAKSARPVGAVRALPKPCFGNGSVSTGRPTARQDRTQDTITYHKKTPPVLNGRRSKSSNPALIRSGSPHHRRQVPLPAPPPNRSGAHDMSGQGLGPKHQIPSQQDSTIVRYPIKFDQLCDDAMLRRIK